MRKKLLWVLAVLVGAGIAVNIVDRRRAKRTRKLWAEATSQP